MYRLPPITLQLKNSSLYPVQYADVMANLVIYEHGGTIALMLSKD